MASKMTASYVQQNVIFCYATLKYVSHENDEYFK